MATTTDVCNLVKRLNPAQLDAAYVILSDWLAEAEDQAEDQAGDNENGRNGRRAAGHVELKMIGKCGPYAYLRYWEGKHLRSKYMGKVRNI